jgi:hypothetical protein
MVRPFTNTKPPINSVSSSTQYLEEIISHFPYGTYIKVSSFFQSQSDEFGCFHVGDTKFEFSDYGPPPMFGAIGAENFKAFVASKVKVMNHSATFTLKVPDFAVLALAFYVMPLICQFHSESLRGCVTCPRYLRGLSSEVKEFGNDKTEKVWKPLRGCLALQAGRYLDADIKLHSTSSPVTTQRVGLMKDRLQIQPPLHQ